MDDNEVSASIIRITPALRLTTSYEHVNVYAKAGCVIGFNGHYVDNYEGESYNTNPPIYGQAVKITQEYKGRTSAGFSGSIGFLYNASKNISIFLEGNGIAHSWAPKKGEITQYEINGTNQLSSLTVSEREFEFVDKVTENNHPPADEPEKILMRYIPMSAFFINIGVQLRFGSSSKKKDSAAPQKK